MGKTLGDRTPGAEGGAPSGGPPAVQLEHVSKSFGTNTVLNDVSLTIEREVVQKGIDGWIDAGEAMGPHHSAQPGRAQGGRCT